MALWELITLTPSPTPPPMDWGGSGVAVDSSLIVSVLAFIISGATLGWTLYRHYIWNRPRLVVSGRWMLSREGTSESPKMRKFWDLEVVVVNIGDIETTLEDIYWEFEDSQGHTFNVQGSTDTDEFGMNGETGSTTFTGAALEPSMPLSIARFTSKRWLFRRDTQRSLEAIDKAVRGRAAVKWIAREAVQATSGEHPHIVTAFGPWQSFDTKSPNSAWHDRDE